MTQTTIRLTVNGGIHDVNAKPRCFMCCATILN